MNDGAEGEAEEVVVVGVGGRGRYSLSRRKGIYDDAGNDLRAFSIPTAPGPVQERERTLDTRAVRDHARNPHPRRNEVLFLSHLPHDDTAPATAAGRIALADNAGGIGWCWPATRWLEAEGGRGRGRGDGVGADGEVCSTRRGAVRVRAYRREWEERTERRKRAGASFGTDGQEMRWGACDMNKSRARCETVRRQPPSPGLLGNLSTEEFDGDLVEERGGGEEDFG